MERIRVNKKFATLAVLGMAGLASITGCNKKATTEDTTAQNVVYVTQDEYNQLLEEIRNKSTNTDAAEKEFVDGDLDIYNEASIDNEATNSYETYKEFYDNHGMDVEEIKDVIYVLNDKYTDENGNPILTTDRAVEAYGNIDQIMGSGTNSEINQKIDNINTINYVVTDDEALAEQQESISDEVKEDNSTWKIEKHPTFENLVDADIPGGAKTSGKLSEYVEMRDTVIDGLNKDVIEKDTIADYVKKQEVTDYNRNESGMGAVEGNGQKYAIASSCNSALQMASPAFYTETYLPGYDAIDQNIKINPTNEEIFLENTIIDMIENGSLDKDVANSVINEISLNTKMTEQGLVYTGEEEELLKKYAITNDQLRLLMSYSFYRTTMAYVKYKEVMCDEVNETCNELDNLSNEVSSNNLTYTEVKTLVLRPNYEQA